MNKNTTFSFSVKSELIKSTAKNRKVQLAELAAYMIYFGKIIHKYNGALIYFESENEFAAKRYSFLIRKLFGISPEAGFMRFRQKDKPNAGSVLYGVVICNPKDGSAVCHALNLKSMDENGKVDYPYIDAALLSQPACKSAFLRGVFISAGNISDPKKSYHLEIYSSDERLADIFLTLMSDFLISGKMIRRKRNFVVYIKEADMISDMLRVIGAPGSLMEFENIRILHDIANKVNRQSNCEVANIKKTVSASSKQVDDIRYIKACHRFNLLPESLTRLAELRLQYDDIPLKELGEMLNPPLSKSGVNHRMRKIAEIADHLRKENQRKNSKEE